MEGDLGRSKYIFWAFLGVGVWRFLLGVLLGFVWLLLNEQRATKEKESGRERLTVSRVGPTAAKRERLMSDECPSTGPCSI
jgi:hypothetical protein